MDSTLDVELALDDESLRALETDVRLATHLRALSSVMVATAHDVRTPLHTMVLYLELLRNTLAEGPGPDRQERQGRYLEVLASELWRLDTMLDSLIAQVRLAEGPAGRVDLAATVKGVLEFLEPQCRRRRIEIQSDVPADPVFVEIRPDAIRHMLTYLLVIAIDVTTEGETLSVQVAARDGHATVGITGSEALGDRMREVPNEENGVERLTGGERGLAVARRVVEQHHGTIYLRSGASRAATLEIELPLSAAEEDRSHARSSDR